jgi:acetoin utilization deacetylase AcuC-like enzyme
MADELLLLSDPRLLAHDPGADHPESPARLAALLDAFTAAPIAHAALQRQIHAPAADDAILRVHTPAHLAALADLRGQRRAIASDTVICPDSADLARLAAGAGVAAIDALYAPAPAPRRAFVLVRPPGHHAKRARMMGFCLLNNLAIAAEHARAVHGAQRVLIVDWDVHHGNGTEDIFWERRDTLVFDSHQSPLYPGTGELDRVGGGDARGYTLNLPLPAGAGDGDLLAYYRALLVPVADAFRPDLILVSAGFDGHRDDPLGGLELSEHGYAALTGLVRELADRHAGGRLALFLEGGYDIPALVASARACAEVLAGAQAPADPPPSERARALIDIFRAHHALFWPQLRRPGA